MRTDHIEKKIPCPLYICAEKVYPVGNTSAVLRKHFAFRRIRDIAAVFALLFFSRWCFSLPKITQVTVFDEATGEVLTDKWIYGARLKGGWCMLYQQKGLDLIAQAPNASVLKVFMYLACGQTYQGGMKTTKRAVEQNLGLGHKAVALAFKWLKDNFIVHEWRVDGCSEFMVSPVYVCVGKFDERMKLWNQRWEDFKPMYATRSYHRKKQQGGVVHDNVAT